MSTHPAAHGAHDEAHHATPSAKYVQIAVILFVLTALEVGLYELSHRSPDSFFGNHFVAILLALSALKFWFVVMFYMHLKSDIKILSWVFSFSLMIAIVVILALFVLFTYNRTLWWHDGAAWR